MNDFEAEREFRETCRDSPVLGGLDEEALAGLHRMALCHEYPENNILLYQEDPPGHVFLILQGRVKVTLNDRRGRQVVLEVATPGELVGVGPLLADAAQSANAITASASQLAKFKGESFLRWIEKHPEVRPPLLGYLAGRLRHAHRRVGAHALLNVRERLLFTLMDIARREGRPGPDEDSVVVERPTHQELAYHIGSSREVVTRTLKELVEDGTLEGKGRVIEVPKSALVLRDE